MTTTSTTSTTTTTTPDLDAEIVAEALHRTASAWRPAETVEIHFARFEPIFHEEKWRFRKYGTQLCLSGCDWVEARSRAALAPFPVEGQKGSLPAEIGALLAVDAEGRVRRRNRDVLAFTWIFVDSDKGASAATLRAALDQLNVYYLLAESATSRFDGNPPKWHLFLPLATPKTLPARSLPGVDDAVTLRATEAWWRRVNDHVRDCLWALGGIDPAQKADASTTDMARLAYVPHSPDGKERMRAGTASSGGRLVDLDGFLRATGFDDIEPPLVRLAEAATTETSTSRAQAAAEGGHGGEPSSDLDEDDDGGATVGETTGRLVYKALDWFHLVGPRDDDPNAFQTLCPWREFHSGDKGHDPERHDDSVLVYVKGERAGETGGFKCFHNGSGADGQCSKATAADVLRWARKLGCPLPDRAEYGGHSREELVAAPSGPVEARPEGAQPLPSPPPAEPLATAPKAQDAKPRKSAPEFPGAPAQGDPAQAPPSASRPRDAAPKLTIEITDQIHEMRDEAIQALARHSSFFKTGGRLFDLVEPETERDKNGFPTRPWLRKTVSTHLKAELSKVSTWVRTVKTRGGEELRGARPDDAAVGAVLAAGQFPGVRQLDGIVGSPVFRRSGTLLQRPGYDPELCVIYRPAGLGAPPISPNPGLAELVAARAKLLRIVQDFPLAEPDLGRAVWLSIVFTRLLRFSFKGNVPLFAITAGQAGSGKGKLADAATAIAEGALALKLSIKDDAEIDRVLGAAVSEEAPIIVLDNIPRGEALKSATLEAYLTTPTFVTRRIGTSDMIKAEKGGWTDTLLVATGNDLTTSGDLQRRSLWIAIDDRTGRPEDRQHEIPDLENFCLQKRPELLAAALTLLSGFFAAKRRGWRVELPPFASFEGWGLVREAIVWCGLPDPFLARGKAEQDENQAVFGLCLQHMLGLTGGAKTRIGDIVDKLKRDKGGPARKHADAWNFFTDRGVKLEAQEGRAAAISFGAFLKPFLRQTWVATDGRRYQLHRREEGGGTFVQVLEVA